jgi:CHAT domain-containing protein
VFHNEVRNAYTQQSPYISVITGNAIEASYIYIDIKHPRLHMNEQRQQAYLNLIERLLNCPSGEEPEILQANQDLLDADFLQMLEVAAEMKVQQGDENAANWLRNLAIQLREALNLSSPTAGNISEEDLQAHLQFLVEVLQATAESGGDAQVVYPLLVSNRQYLNLNLAELLRRWATNTLAEVETNVAQSIAVDIGNFSNLIQQFPLGDKASNMEIAIAGYEVVSTMFTRDAFPQDWAMTQNNLAIAYSDRIRGDKAQNIELAIASYTNALEVRTKDAFPQDWAMTQNNLGAAYRNRIRGDKAQNIELAIASYTNALEVTTKDAFPQNHAETLFNLGIAYQDAQRFSDAYTTFHSAIETAELLRGEIVSGEESKRKQAEEWNKLYRRMVEVCLELKNSPEAIEYIERSKTRNLVELLFTPDSYPKLAISEVFKNQLQQLQQDIEEEKRRIEQAEKSNPHDIINRTQLNELRQRREQLITRIVGLNPIRYDEIYNLLNHETAIIQFYIFDNCFRAFIITRHKEQPEIWQSQPQDLEKLVNWMDEYLQLYFEDKQRWRHYLNDKLNKLAETLHIQEILSLVPQECKKVVLIPHRYLHLLSLHALPLSSGESSEEYLIDKFSKGVSYAPSCQLWRMTQNKAKTLSDSPFHHLFAIQNPTDNLEFTDIEVETIAAAFHPRHILKKNQATAQALREPTTAENFHNANWLHFSCHGYFNFNLPEKSALQLAASEISPLAADAETSRYLRISDDAGIDLKKCLTLEDIFQLSLPNCRLVTLSACETGLIDIFNTSDEYIGLPSGFIRAGAASIVSSLWTVNDFSTALLMIKFYENLETVTQNVPLALNSAQQWFRRVTQRELLQWLDGKTDMDVQQKERVKEILEKNYKPKERPFKHPAFWAAFCAVGE